MDGVAFDCRNLAAQKDAIQPEHCLLHSWDLHPVWKGQLTDNVTDETGVYERLLDRARSLVRLLVVTRVAP